MVDTVQDSSSNWRMGRRGISGITAAIILVVVVVVVGGAGYAGLSAAGGSSSSSPPAACAPLTSPVCSTSARVNDVVLFVPYQPGYGQTAFQSSQGATLPASVYLTNGETASSFSVNWGDGTTSTQGTTSFTHAYSGLGSYVVSATATVSGVTHTGTSYLFPVVIGPSTTTESSGHFPGISASFSNGTTGGTRPWIHAGGTVTVAASYSSLPSAAGYTALPPSITASSGATLVQNGSSADAAMSTYSFSTAGVYTLTFVGPISTPTGTVDQNYIWTVYVGVTGSTLACTYCTSGGSSGGSPHPGTIYSYEIAAGGATSLDPSVDYETVGGEVIMNVYEQLVNYNASSTGSFVPVLSTCVPGAATTGPNSCTAQFGNDLNGPLTGSTGQGTYWTFPISPTAQFYNPSNGAHWGVYPTDVMFSILRTMMWLQTPSQYVYNGWIIGQALLPYQTTAGWDNNIHTPWNNTPQNMLDSMLINDTAYCPASAIANDHGCITFVADGSSQTWPFFLEFVEDMEGASVVPCGWFSAHGGGIPGGWGTSVAGGDGPCMLPDGGTTTNNSAWTSYVNGLAPTAYDNLIEQGALNPYQPQPSVRWSVVGSGPYYPVSVNVGQGYVLKANPYYAKPTCVAAPGCYPAPGSYAPNVYVFWDSSSTAGIEQYIAGQADFASFYPTDTPTILNLVKEGKIGLLSVPTLDVFNFGYNFWLNDSATEAASSLTMNVPPDFFDNPGLRAFLSAAFPYNYSLNEINTADGITYDDNLGGAIPNGMGDYYPTNISWPGYDVATGTWSNPSTSYSATGGAAYWWSQITNPSSSYYDAELVADCTSGSPCTWPTVSELGAAPLDSAVDAWNTYIYQISNHTLDPTRWDPTFSTLVANSADPPGTSPFPIEIDGWAPDYPDPTDYMVPYYAANGSYTYGAGLGQVLLGGPTAPLGTPLSPGPYYCPEVSAGQLGSTVAQNFSALQYWANGPLVNQTCQGSADQVMNWWMNYNSVNSNLQNRILIYNMIEHLANNLELYMYYEQEVGIGSYANWINPSTITTNSVQPGQQWYLESGLNVW